MLRGFVLAGVLLTITAGGCSGSSTAHGLSDGTLVGVLELSSAVPGGSARGVPGTITMHEANATTRTADAGSDGKFSTTVPAGWYIVTGRSAMFIINGKQGTCVIDSSNGPQPVHVTVGQTTSVTVECPTK